ncbi:MAG: nucleotidyltransferase domain-containing protein [Methanocellales archaeon]
MIIRLLLFGSLARREELPFPKSDVDLIVVTKKLPRDLFERAKIVREIESSPALIQSIWLTEGEFLEQFKARTGYILDAIQDGIIIHDKGFLRKTIPKAKRELRKRGIKRVGSAWVWLVKKAGEIIEL